MPSTPAPLSVRQVPLERLHTAPWNANVVKADTLAKVRRSMVDFGIVENLVARPLPNPCRLCGGTDHLEVISGNHRLEILAELGAVRASCHVVELDDARARILAQTLNRTRGTDDPERYAELLRVALAEVGMDGVTAYLPETERSIDKILKDALRVDANFATMPRGGKPKSKRGELYELGPHRLLCGDSTSADDVAKLLDDATPLLMLADPPYGVNLDMDWRRGGNRRAGGEIQTKTPARYSKAAGIMNDHRVDWSPAYALVPSIVVAYVWHASSVGHIVGAGLESVGCTSCSRSSGTRARSRSAAATTNGSTRPPGSPPGSRPRTCPGTARDTFPRSMPANAAQPSPGSAAPTKPPSGSRSHRSSTAAALTRPTKASTTRPKSPSRSIRGRSRTTSDQARSFYEPFGGSGTTIIAAELTDRVAYAMELDPRFCDVIRQRYADFTGDPTLAP